MDDKVEATPSQRSSRRVRGEPADVTGPGLQTPKRSKLDQALDQAPATQTGHPETAPPADDDKASVKSNKSEARRKKLEAELAAMKELEQLNEERRQARRAILEKELELQRAIADSDEEPTVQANKSDP